VLDVIREASVRSATFAGILAALDATDAFVYVQPGVCAFGNLDACLPQTIGVGSGARYLRVLFDPYRSNRAQVIALIGHELQHALEIAQAPTVRSHDDVIRLFQRIGFSPHCPQGLPDCYETDTARTVGDRIRTELQRPVAGR